MKGRIANFLKVVIPLGIGVFVAWYQFDKLSAEQLDSILTSFRSADYVWVALSVLAGFASHWSRAFRWKYLLAPMGIHLRFINSFFSVFIGYVANIILPRFGEVWRCVMVSRYEKQPFEKLFGSVVAERIADVVVVSGVMAVTVALQLSLLGDKIRELLGDRLQPDAIPGLIAKLVVVALIGLVAAFVFWRMLKRSTLPLFVKLRGIVAGLTEGVTSILRMESKWSFVGHTSFIWGMYLTMFFLPFLALPETAHVPLGGMLASFVMGSLSIALVQGGIGVYPIAVAETLRLYDVPYESGLALGWIIWTSQTALIVIAGIGSMALMPLANRKG
ncbi:MAG: flippase-like domain-containing protein [Flavobacteriales bacterium]|nr:flippase-like domain-containing protein [Flavobacteriales bacterium]